jgi:hypothetical protein
LLVPDTEFGANSESEALLLQHADDESPPFIPCTSYIDFFVPELFDIQPTLPVRESTDLSAREGDPPSYQPSASISSLQSTQAEIKAEYLQFIVVWIMLCWRIVSQGFWLLKAALRVLVHEGFASEIANSVVIDSGEFADDSIDSFAEPRPPDKIVYSYFHSFIHTKGLLIKDIVQDTQHSSPSSQVQATELDNSLNVTDSDLIQNHRQDFHHAKCKPFISFSFEPITEHPSNYEPFKRAEIQPFSPCTCYVDYFVPQLFEPIPESFNHENRIFDQVVPVQCPQPEDDPPSYQDSVHSATHSTPIRAQNNTAEIPEEDVPPDKISDRAPHEHGIEAEHTHFIISSIPAWLNLSLRYFFGVFIQVFVRQDRAAEPVPPDKGLISQDSDPSISSK